MGVVVACKCDGGEVTKEEGAFGGAANGYVVLVVIYFEPIEVVSFQW
jgi:hypothetical protein